MRLCRLLKLSHAEFITRRKTIGLSVLAAGIPLAILLIINLVMTGAIQTALHYASRPTDGAVYFLLANSTGDPAHYVTESHGEIIQQITTADLDNNNSSPLILLADLAELSPEQIAAIPRPVSTNYDLHHFNLINLLLNKIPPYQPPFGNDMEVLKASLADAQLILAKFPNLRAAHQYTDTLAEHHSKTTYTEVFSNFYATDTAFRTETASLQIFNTAALVIAAVIVVGTFVYLLDQNLHAMVVYRALGASTRDLIIISLGYLLEISLALMIYVIILALAGASIFSLLSASQVSEFFHGVYNVAQPRLLMLGWNLEIVWLSLAVLLSAPVSLLLMADQFSTKRLSQRLKQN